MKGSQSKGVRASQNERVRKLSENKNSPTDPQRSEEARAMLTLCLLYAYSMLTLCLLYAYAMLTLCLLYAYSMLWSDEARAYSMLPKAERKCKHRYISIASDEFLCALFSTQKLVASYAYLAASSGRGI